MREEKVVMYDSPEAATYKTYIEGWVSNGDIRRFWGKDEHIARWSGCTHMVCECGKTYAKGRVRCDSCQSKLDSDKYNALPLVEWDETTPVCEYQSDRYFFDKDDLFEFMFDLLDEAKGKDYEPCVELVICEPQYLHRLDSDNWVDDLADDGEIPDAVLTAIDAFNEVLKAQGPSCWFPGKKRIDVDALWTELKDDLAKEAATADKASEEIQ